MRARIGFTIALFGTLILTFGVRIALGKEGVALMYATWEDALQRLHTMSDRAARETVH